MKVLQVMFPHSVCLLLSGLVMALPLTVTGCGGEEQAPSFSSVEGKVTTGGEPAPKGTKLIFHGQSDDKTFLVLVGDDGTYRYDPSAQGGPEPGTYKVSVHPPAAPTKEVDGMSVPVEDAPDYSDLIPSKYGSADTSGLTVTLETDQDAQLDIEL